MDVTAFSVSKHLSDLVGRHVSAKEAGAVEFSPETRTACYTVDPHSGTAVVKLDFHLLAGLAGTMIGFPLPEIEAQIKEKKLGDDLTDAANEVMNVLSAVIVSEGRATFKGTYLQASEYSNRAVELGRGGFFPLSLLITPSGGKSGYMTIVSDTV